MREEYEKEVGSLKAQLKKAEIEARTQRSAAEAKVIFLKFSFFHSQ